MSLDKNLSRFDKVRHVLGAHKRDQERQRRWTAALLPRVFLFADAAVRALMTGVKYQLDRHSTFAENVLGSCLAVESFLFFFFALATSFQGILFFFSR